MKISIIGAGNVATNLALALKKAGHEIVQIYNRSDDAGKELAHTVAASFTSNAVDLLDADVYLVAVKDDVIAEIAEHLKLADKIVVTSKLLILFQFQKNRYHLVKRKCP